MRNDLSPRPIAQLLVFAPLLAGAAFVSAAPVSSDPEAIASDEPAGTHKSISDEPEVDDEQSTAPGAAEESAHTTTTLRGMFENGRIDGNLRMLYYANHNPFFLDAIQGDHDRNSASVGGRMGFTTAALHGFSLRLSAFAQRNFARSSNTNDLGANGYERDLGRDIAALGEAYLQYER